MFPSSNFQPRHYVSAQRSEIQVQLFLFKRFGLENVQVWIESNGLRHLLTSSVAQQAYFNWR